MLGWDAQEGNRGNLSVLLARSTDLGETWTSTITIVYVGWNSRRPPPSGPPVGVKPMVAVSAGGGKTFAPASDLRGIAFDAEETRAGIVAATTGKPVAPRLVRPPEVRRPHRPSSTSPTATAAGNPPSPWTTKVLSVWHGRCVTTGSRRAPP